MNYLTLVGYSLCFIYSVNPIFNTRLEIWCISSMSISLYSALHLRFHALFGLHGVPCS